MALKVICSTCKGEGKISRLITTKCPKCNGEGRTKTKSLNSLFKKIS